MLSYSKKLAFSLIELMIVITIIGILAAVAVPSYQRYTLKAKIAGAYPIMNALASQLIEAYQLNGSFPATHSFNGATMTAGAFYNGLNIMPIKNFYYRIDTTGGGVSSIQIWAVLSGLTGMSTPAPVYVEPTTGYTKRSLARLLVVANDGVFNKYCGISYSGNDNDVPLEYLPGSCSCTNLDAIGQTGAAPVC